MKLKNVGTAGVDYPRLDALPVAGRFSDPAEFEETKKWRLPKTYETLLAGTVPTAREARLFDEDVDRLVAPEYQKAELMPRDWSPKGACNFFTIEEKKKKVRRGLQHPKVLNDRVTRDMLLRLRFANRAGNHATSRRGRYAITFDFATWYDQHRLAPGVDDFFAFRAKGRWYRLKVLPMGFRAAVEVGHQATLRIMDFVMPEGVYAQALIDNVRFVGDSKEEVLAAARRFVERCAEVNAVLNDADVPLEGRVTDKLNPKGEWLGEIIDYEAKTAECTDATLLKVRESWARRDTWNHRNYSAFIQLMFYTSAILRIDKSRHFAAIRAYREASSRTQRRYETWDDPVPPFIPKHTWHDLALWKDTVLENAPAPLQDPEGEPDVFVMTDASDWGWGVLWSDGASGAIHTYAEPWGDTLSMEERKSSVIAEPVAVHRALCRIIRPNRRCVVRLATDSSAAMWAIRAGYSKSFRMNMIVHRIRGAFPLVDLRPQHVAGLRNSADKGSRGATSELTVKESNEFYEELGIRPHLYASRAGGKSTTVMITN